VSTSLKLYGRSRKTIEIDGSKRSASIQWNRLNSCWPRPEDRDAEGHLCLKDDPDDNEVERDDCFLLGCGGVISNVKVRRKTHRLSLSHCLSLRKCLCYIWF
jgi:hypothetical protein